MSQEQCIILCWRRIMGDDITETVLKSQQASLSTRGAHFFIAG